MSLIQLISNNNESSYYSTNFADIIKIKPYSKIALVDIQLNRDLILDFTNDIQQGISYPFTIDWGDIEGEESGQGGSRETYIFNPANLSNPSRATIRELLDELEKVISNGNFRNYIINFTDQETTQGRICKIQSRFNPNNLSTDEMAWDIVNTNGWDDFDGDALETSTNLVSTDGTEDPDGDYTHNYIINKKYVLPYGGHFGGMTEFSSGKSCVVGLSWEDAAIFGANKFFTTDTAESEFFNLDNTVWADTVPVANVYYKLNVGSNFSEYEMEDLATSTTYADLELSNIQPNSCTVNLTNAANPAPGVDGTLFVGDYGIAKCTLTGAGTGYATGIYQVDSEGGGAGATIEVLTIDGDGGVLTFKIIQEGVYYDVNQYISLDGGDHNCIFIINIVKNYMIIWDDTSPDDIQLFFQPDHISNEKYPLYYEGLPDIPLGIHFRKSQRTEDECFYTIFRHKDNTTYTPYDRDNIKIISNGVFSSDENLIQWEIKIGLNQTFTISLSNPLSEDITVEKTITIIDKDILPDKAHLYGVMLSDCANQIVYLGQYDYNRDPTTDNLIWTNGFTEGDFTNKEYLYIDIDFTDTLERLLGFSSPPIIQRGYKQEGVAISDGILQTQGEGKRLNICIDNLKVNSYKNFSNDYTNIQNGFINGISDRMIGSIPLWINNKNYGVLYHQPQLIYINLNNPISLNINQITVSIRNVETNKLVNELYGSTITTIHIKE